MVPTPVAEMCELPTPQTTRGGIADICAKSLQQKEIWVVTLVSRMKVCSTGAITREVPGMEREFQLMVAAKSSVDARKALKLAKGSSGKAAKSTVVSERLPGGLLVDGSAALLLAR